MTEDNQSGPEANPNDANPAQADSRHDDQPQPETDRKPKLLKLMPWILSGIFLLTSVGLAIAYVVQTSSLQASLEKTKDELRTTDSFYKIADKNAKSAQENLDRYKKDHPAKDDEALLKELSAAWYNGQKSEVQGTVNVTISKVVLPFAETRLNGTTENYLCSFKKVEQTWVLINCGRGSLDKFQRATWLMPEDF